MCLLIKPDMETVNCSGAETRQQQSCPLSSIVVLSEPFPLCLKGSLVSICERPFKASNGPDPECLL